MLKAPEGFKALLKSGASTICRCWLVTRKDGVKMGFTDHDRPLTFDNIIFDAESGVTASAFETSLGAKPSTMSISGAIKENSINEKDIIRGFYSGADVTMWFVDWSNTNNRILMTRGTISEIRRDKHSFEAEIVGCADLLNRSFGRSYLRTCDCDVGDKRCGIVLQNPIYETVATVVDVLDQESVIFADLEEFSNNWFDFGKFRWLTGENKNVTGRIRLTEKSDNDTVIHFTEMQPLLISVGDRISLTVGCDKNANTCKDKFNNLLNFRGFPHMPGDDWVTSYPTTGVVHDGGSLLRG